MSEKLSGGCRCGAVRYEVSAIVRNSICHCRDCQRSSGAPMVEWMLVDDDALSVTGETATFESSPGTLRSFCRACGTGLFYRNAAVFPDQVDVQTATLDEPHRAPDPAAQVQTAEARGWVAGLASIHAFERYPWM
jgi:hypothetical protein